MRRTKTPNGATERKSMIEAMPRKPSPSCGSTTRSNAGRADATISASPVMSRSLAQRVNDMAGG
jgi:hypothetical protein